MRTEAFDAALQRRLATSSKDHMAVLAQQARGIMKEIVRVTPPGTDGVAAGTRKAQEMGRTAVARDIYAVYGTPGTAFDLLEQTNKGVAQQFWGMHKEGRVAEAQLLFQVTTGQQMKAFDGGAEHQRARKSGGRVSKTQKRVFYVTEKRPLEKYVAEVQKRVHYLAAGWEEGAAKLGIQLPQIIAKHTAPGSVVYEIGEYRLRIEVTNAVSYASQADVERRIAWAVKAQTNKMDREWQDWMAKLNKKAGL